MLFFESLDASLPFFKAMASEIRIKILNILAAEENVNINAPAQRLNLTNGALTTHIRVLEEVSLIDVKTISAKHGTRMKKVNRFVQKSTGLSNNSTIFNSQ